MKQLPLISVITVSYNQGEFIEDNIRSVLDQSYPNFEHIIVDAGSTDQTLDILRRYPHLKWSSEPDRGQSDGLNKGFRQAQGEIIAWLNSDDWYAPNIFHEVAENLVDYPILLAQAQRVNIDGQYEELIPNYTRSYYDLLRHWLPYNWLAQTSVFFTRSLLEEVKLADGVYLDESLHYSMDLDLWLRIAEKVSFSKRVPKVFSYFRVYDENKTGARPKLGKRENSRVFRRTTKRKIKAENSISLILPVEEMNDQTLEKTIQSIDSQIYYNAELLVVDSISNGEESKKLKNYVYDLSEKWPSISCRYLKSDNNNLIASYNLGISHARSPLLATIRVGDILPENFTFQAQMVLHEDVAGAALPLAARQDLAARLWDAKSNNPGFANIVSMPYVFPNIVAKTVAMQELNGFGEHSSCGQALMRTLLLLLWNSWRMRVADGLVLGFSESQDLVQSEQFSIMQPYYIADTFLEAHKIHSEVEVNTNYVRLGVRPVWQESTINLATMYTSSLPVGWRSLSRSTDPNVLKQLTLECPKFPPPWYFLALQYRSNGLEIEAQKLEENYHNLINSDYEQQMPFRKLVA